MGWPGIKKGTNVKIGIDWDGVMVKRKGIPTEPADKAWMDTPIEGARETISLLTANGVDCYVLTNRPKGDWKRIKQWLEFWKFPSLRITNTKEDKTTIYLDDRAVRFTTWNDFRKLIL